MLVKRQDITGLYYITHINNVPSILSRGIYCHERIEDEKIDYTRIYEEGIVTNRKDIKTPDGRTLWKFVNLYFQPRNPMLYKVLHEKPANELVIISIKPEVINRLDIYITTGNAAHSASEILSSGESRKALRKIIKDTEIEYWKEEDGSKRRIMAECLVPDIVPPNLIQTIYTASRTAKANLEAAIPPLNIPVVTEPNKFFQPLVRQQLTPRLYLAEGDMFFSKAQTITISVNTVGIMGKGLASRTRYQFSDVYVYYEDLCRSRKLKMGKPQLYKRESSLDYELADEPQTLPNGNKEKWFLLFPTKRHWRERADFVGIEEGLKWLASNYKKEGIKSLAVPALGCGLGRLDWRDVGPLMCRYLKDFDIIVVIYLPTERETPKEFISKDFLLS
jgi:hypothetical protein